MAYGDMSLGKFCLVVIVAKNLVFFFSFRNANRSVTLLVLFFCSFLLAAGLFCFLRSSYDDGFSTGAAARDFCIASGYGKVCSFIFVIAILPSCLILFCC
jgi:hypothetical protein